MATLLRPNVNIAVQSALNLIAPSGPGIIAIVGTAQWGPINTLQELDNFSQAIDTFKDDSSTLDLTLIPALDLAFGNGAGSIKAVRIDDGAAASSSVTLVSGATSVVQVFGFYKGTYGNNISVAVTANGSNRDALVTDGIVTELYDNGGTGYSTNLSLVEDINDGSALVEATSLNNTFLVDAVTATNLSGGDDGENALVSSDFTDAIDDVLMPQDWDILVIPGQTSDSFHSTIISKLQSRVASEDKFSVYLSGIGVDETIATAQARTAASEFFGLVAPNVVKDNRISGTEEILDGSYLACAYAGIVAKNFPAVSATHKIITVQGLSINETAGTEFYNKTQQNTLLNARIVPITKISGVLMPSRAVTRIADTTDVFYEQNIVTTSNYLKKQVLDLLNGYIGEPNLERVRNIIAKNVDGLLEQNINEEILTSYQPTTVTVGASPDTINVEMNVLPVFALNFIKVTVLFQS